MTYSVIWQPVAEQQFKRIWRKSPDQDCVRMAAQRIRQSLAYAPLTRSRWLSWDTRVLYVSPLAVGYEIVEDDKLVRILGVWEF